MFSGLRAYFKVQIFRKRHDLLSAKCTKLNRLANHILKEKSVANAELGPWQQRFYLSTMQKNV